MTRESGRRVVSGATVSPRLGATMSNGFIFFETYVLHPINILIKSYIYIYNHYYIYMLYIAINMYMYIYTYYNDLLYIIT